jgi:hypothetical protein
MPTGDTKKKDHIAYLRLFASALVDELETTLRSHETVEDSFR